MVNEFNWNVGSTTVPSSPFGARWDTYALPRGA